MQLDNIWERQLYFKKLPMDSVQLWCQSIHNLAMHTDFFNSLLSDDENLRAKQFVFAADQQRYIIGRGFMRYLLAHYLQLPAQDLQFSYNVYGKPEIINHENLHFNLSNTKTFLLIGLGQQQSIGVDIECVREELDMLSLAQRFFTSQEQQKLLELPQAEKQAMFYSIWTRKEAVLKALGKGLSYPLDQLDVLSGDSCCLTTENNQTFFIRSMPIASNHYAAFACSADLEKNRVDYFNFTGNIRRSTLSL
jgi:4'-phosphopantetheinyl transferase